jgi:hypothetical protein
MSRSGLTKRELSTLYGVSRQTLYIWEDSPPGQKTLAERAEKYTDGLVAALDKNLLPFSSNMSPERRAEFLLTMAKRLHTLTAPK